MNSVNAFGICLLAMSSPLLSHSERTFLHSVSRAECFGSVLRRDSVSVPLDSAGGDFGNRGRVSREVSKEAISATVSAHEEESSERTVTALAAATTRISGGSLTARASSIGNCVQ